MASTLQPVRGTHDLLANDFAQQELITQTAQRISSLYGYARIDTPIFEFSEVFHRAVGETSDIVSKETYTFTDRGGESITLRPEFTAAIVRSFISNGLQQNLPFKCFYAGPAFRYEPYSTTHHPEFTMLEWYRAYAGYEDIQRDTERLVESIALKLFGRAVIRFQGHDISVASPWPRLRVRDLFRDLAGIDLVAAADVPVMRRECDRRGLSWQDGDTWDDLYFRIWLNLIEPKLPADRAVFVTRYPASQAALAVVDSDPDGSRWARRFEVYAGGLELGNAFEELTDPVEQRRRFEHDMHLRAQLYGPSFLPSPIDEGFLDALAEGMPPAGGIAMGVDRLVMLFADEPQIDYTLWLESWLSREGGPASPA
jgi:lysyl-tRNA synthetase class 2